MVGSLVNNEFEGIRKEAAVIQLQYYRVICLEEQASRAMNLS
jgi:hypothetical protein